MKDQSSFRQLSHWAFPSGPAKGKKNRRFQGTCRNPRQVRNTTQTSGQGSADMTPSFLLLSPQFLQKKQTLMLSNNNINQRHLLSSFSAERPFKLPTVCFGLLPKS
jgi:hypothetical protein